MLCVMKTIVLFEDLVRTMARPLALLGVGGGTPPKPAGEDARATRNTRLATGEVRRISSTSGRLRIECESGRLWITDGQRGDVLLEAGHCFETAEAGGAIIEALTWARFNVATQTRGPGAAGVALAPEVILFPATHRTPTLPVEPELGKVLAPDFTRQPWLEELHKTAVAERVIFALLAACGAALFARFLGLFW